MGSQIAALVDTNRRWTHRPGGRIFSRRAVRENWRYSKSGTI